MNRQTCSRGRHGKSLACGKLTFFFNQERKREKDGEKERKMKCIIK